MDVLILGRGAPFGVVVGVDRVGEQRVALAALEGVEVGGAREQHAQDQGEGAGLAPEREVGMDERGLGDVPARDALEVLRRRPGQFADVLGGRAQGEGTALEGGGVMAYLRDLGEGEPLRPRPPPQPSPAVLSTACSSTLAPASRSSGVAFSISLWLMPPSQGTKIMPVGATLAM